MRVERLESQMSRRGKSELVNNLSEARAIAVNTWLGAIPRLKSILRRSKLSLEDEDLIRRLLKVTEDLDDAWTEVIYHRGDK